MSSKNETFIRHADSGTLGYGDIFSDVFKRHTEEETARVFIAGTPMTTPQRKDMLVGWMKPYLFLRFFIIMLLSVAALFFVSLIYGGNKYTLYPGVSLFPCLVPFTCMVLVWELHIPRNIALYEVIKMVFVGGVVSIVTGVLAFELIYVIASVNVEARWAGLVEEPAKLLAVYYFLGSRKKKRPYILNGILIGFAVGTGFSFMESIGYTFDQGMGTGIARALNSFSGHAFWASLYGGALAEAKGEDNLSPLHLLNPLFLVYFILAVVLHFFNNMNLGLPFFADGIISTQHLILTVINLAIWLVMLRRGVNQIVGIVAAENGGLTAGIRHGEEAASFGGDVYFDTPSGQSRYKEETVWYLQGTSGEYAGRRIDLYEGMSAAAGRDGRQCMIAFPNSPHVSGKHCSLRLSGQNLIVQDLGSSNGTFIGGQKIQPYTDVIVPEGAVLSLGNESCSFRLVRDRKGII